VKEKLRERMVNAFENVYQTAQSRNIDMRLAAYMVGVRRTAEACRFRGWV
jgi:glutamate dehydrogenase